MKKSELIIIAAILVFWILVLVDVIKAHIKKANRKKWKEYYINNVKIIPEKSWEWFASIPPASGDFYIKVSGRFQKLKPFEKDLVVTQLCLLRRYNGDFIRADIETIEIMLVKYPYKKHNEIIRSFLKILRENPSELNLKRVKVISSL